MIFISYPDPRSVGKECVVVGVGVPIVTSNGVGVRVGGNVGVGTVVGELVEVAFGIGVKVGGIEGNRIS